MSRGGKRMVMWSSDSRQSPNLHTGQFRARGAVNPDSTTGEPAPAHQTVRPTQNQEYHR